MNEVTIEDWFANLRLVSERCRPWEGYMISNGEVQQAIVAVTKILEKLIQNSGETAK